MLTIKHLTGPLAGTETIIERQCDRVVFGRQMECEVAFPPETTLVSGRHFALVRKGAGNWTVDLFGGPFVSVDGRSAEQGQLVRNGTKLELGRKGGPSFETIITADTRLHNYKVTETQQTFEGARSIAEAADKRARIAVVATAIVAVVAVAYGVAQFFYGQASAARLNDALAQMAAAEGRAAETSIGTAVRNKVVRSVYLVYGENRLNGGLTGIGTAWPVGPHLLGTNAHVAEDRAKLPPDTDMKVRSPGPDGKVYIVTGVRIHPGYAALQKFRRKDVIASKDPQGGVLRADRAVPGYDVALLEVKEELPKDQILELAPPARGKSLHAGQPIATAGYPGENILGDKAALIRATPELHLGTITGVTNFFFLPGDDDHRQLIHNDLPIAGGASGSPVLDSSGYVIGLQSAGNMNFLEVNGRTVRMPSAALLNYAQRADMLRDLIDNNQDKVLKRDETYWNEQIGYFKRGIDLLLPSIVDDAKAKPDNVATSVLDQTLKLTGADAHAKQSGGVQRQKAIPLTITSGSTYVFVAYGFEEADLELYIMIGKKVVGSAKGSWYPSIKYRMDAPEGGDAAAAAWFPSLKAPEQAKADLELWVVSPEDKDVSYVLRAYRIDARQPAG